MTRDAALLSVALAPDALTLRWSDGEWSVAASILRASCRCAPCQSARLRGESAADDAGLTLVDALPIGHYAVQLRFSDGHERGIYPWGYLRELASEAMPAVASERRGSCLLQREKRLDGIAEVTLEPMMNRGLIGDPPGRSR